MDRGHDQTRQSQGRRRFVSPNSPRGTAQQKRISTFSNAFMGFKSSDFQNILGGEMTKKMFMAFLPNALRAAADLLLLHFSKLELIFYELTFITWKTHENLNYVGMCTLCLTLHLPKCLDFATYIFSQFVTQN